MEQCRTETGCRWIAAILCVVAALGITAPSPARAQTPSPLQEWQFPGGIVLEKLFEPNLPEWRGELGVAAALHPLYAGAAPYKVSPGPVINIRYRDIAFASVGEGIGVNVLRGEHYRAGIALTYDLGRMVDRYPSHLSGLGDIEPAPVVKVFLSYAVSKSFPLVLRADVRRVIGGANGWIGDVGAYMPLPGSSKHLFMLAGPSLTFAASDYTQKVFGVNAIQSLHSGFPAYNAHAGLDAVGFGFSATWLFNPHWLFNVDTAVSRLLGSAAQSPITQRKLQGIVALSVAYRF